MKKKIITGVVVTALASVFGCTTTNVSSNNGSITTKPSFNYLIEGGDNWGVVQAFISKGRTHVQFLDIGRAHPTFLDKDGITIEYTPVGMYAVLSQTPLEFYIDSPYGRAHVIDGSLQKAILEIERENKRPSSALPVVEAAELERSLNSLAAEKDALDKEISEQEAALLLAKKQLAELRASSALLNADESNFLGAKNTVIHRVYFADYSTTVVPSILDSDADVVLKASNAAKKIYIRGFTDSNITTDVATELALSRSLNTKKFLVSLGVDPKKIRVFYRSSANFLVENSGDQQRFNRRAEVTYYFGDKYAS